MPVLTKYVLRPISMFGVELAPFRFGMFSPSPELATAGAPWKARKMVELALGVMLILAHARSELVPRIVELMLLPTGTFV